MSNPTQEWDAEVDIIIVGGGGAGLSAAIEAAEAGAGTLVLEKQPKYWDCSTALCGGAVAFAGTAMQYRRGVQDSNEFFYNDLMRVGKSKNDPKIVAAFTANQLETHNWLCRLGVKWATVEPVAGMSVPRAHRTDPLELVKILKYAAESCGTNIIFQARVTGLVTDGERGVVGVTAKELAGPSRIRARRGVVLASGGFGHDTERLAAIDPRFAKVLSSSGRGHTGDGHRMAEALGAYLRDMEYVKPSFSMHVTGTSSVEIFLGYNHGAIIINRKGERFVNESMPNKDIAMAALNEPGSTGFQVFDSKMFDAARRVVEEAEVPISHFTDGLDETKIKLLAKGDTLEELAVAINVPPGNLRRTIERYNADCLTGKDAAFGRTTLAGAVRRIIPIDYPPFYAYETMNFFPSTYAGLTVDEHTRVMSAGGPILGLYAAGEIMGGFHGASYMGGSSVAKSIVFGRIAGRNAARRV